MSVQNGYKGIDVKVAKLTMNYSGRYMAEVEGGKGIVKLVLSSFIYA